MYFLGLEIVRSKKGLNVCQHKYVIDLLIDADSRMRYALSKRTLLEATLVRASRAATVTTVDELMKQVAALKGDIASPSVVQEVPTTAYDVKKKPSDDLNHLKQAWPELIARITKASLQAGQYLRDTVPVSLTNTHLTIGLDPEFSTERSNLEHPRTLSLIQKTLTSFLHRTVAVNFSLLNERPSPMTTETSVKMGSEKEKYYKNPAVRSVLETFSGEITDIRK
jgi:hypothetical protein